jgi:hypothetical protein
MRGRFDFDVGTVLVRLRERARRLVVANKRLVDDDRESSAKLGAAVCVGVAGGAERDRNRPGGSGSTDADLGG